MRFDIKATFIITFFALISGTVTTSTIDSGKLSALSSPFFLTAPLIAETSDSGASSKLPSKSENENLPDRCLACNISGTNPDIAFVPVTDFLSFAATADPQFDNNTARPRVTFPNDIASFLLTKLYKDTNYKGLIIAGDLTERTYKSEILKFCNSLLANEERELSPILERSKELDRLHEGLGNHDMMKGTCCIGGSDKCVCESGLTNIISRGDRQDQISSQPPHYSWEWDGIRFVQLNLLPGDEAETVWNGSGRDLADGE